MFFWLFNKFFFLAKLIKQEKSLGFVNDLDSLSIRLPSSSNIDHLYSILESHSSSFGIKTFSEGQEGYLDLTLRISFKNISNLEKLRNEIKNNFNDVDFAFYENP